MSIPQLSVFVENKPGHLAAALGTLAEGEVNVLSFTIADTADYGILRLVVDQTERAKELLSAAGYAVVEHPVVCALMPDRPGALARIASDGVRVGAGHRVHLSGGTRLAPAQDRGAREAGEPCSVAAGFGVLGPGDLGWIVGLARRLSQS